MLSRRSSLHRTLLHTNGRTACRNQILRMNGLEPGDFQTDQERDEICETLCVDSAAQFGHDPTVVQHESGNKALTKFFYKHSLGMKETAKASTVTTVEDTTGDQLATKSFADMAQKSQGPLRIKMENPQFNDLQFQLSVLKTAKTQLEKAHTEGENISETLQAMHKKSTDSPGLKKLADDMQALRVLLYVSFLLNAQELLPRQLLFYRRSLIGFAFSQFWFP